MKTRFLFFILSFLFIQVQAQTTRSIVSGRVTDQNNLPLSGVILHTENPYFETQSDEQGNYLLKVPVGKNKLTAVFSGYLSSTIPINVQANKYLNTGFTLQENGETLKDVVVLGVKVKSATVTRSLMPIQDIPQSIAVIGQRVIKQQAAIDLTTITRNISGLNFTGNYSGAGSAQFFNARGFDLNESQSFRLNGKMIWNLGNNYFDNIEQVEFLKGPTSILFGDVAPGGIMNFVTKKPLPDFQATLDFKTGSWGLFRPALDITGPITSDRKLRYRLNTAVENAGSFRDYVSSQRQFIAPSIAWDISPKLSLNLEAVIKNSSAVDDAGLVSPDGTIAGLKNLDPSLYLGEPSRTYTYKDQTYYSVLKYELNKSLNIKVTGFYAYTHSRPFGIWFEQPDELGNFARNGYGYHQKVKNASLSVDLYGSFYTGFIKHNLLLGAEYLSTSSRFTNAGELSPLDTNNIYHPVHGEIQTTEPATGPYQPYVSKIQRSGINFQDQMLLFKEKLHVLLGLRLGRTAQGNHYFQDQLSGTEYVGYQDDIISKNVLTPRLGFVYKVKPSTSLYFSYSKGYEINTPDIFARNYTQFASPPATMSSQVELGTKMNLLSNRVGLTASIFEINKTNPYGYLYLDPENPKFDEYEVYYDGHHRSRGIELDVDGKLAQTLSVTAAAAYTRTKVTEDPGYPDGNVLPNAPKLTGNIWLNFEPKQAWKGFSVGAGIFYKDKFFSSLENNPNLEIPASYTLDAAIGYVYKRIGLQLNVSNVTNQISYLNPWQFNLFDVRPPRQFILGLSYRIN
jgi:iron complex outermembrane receptor protein